MMSEGNYRYTVEHGVYGLPEGLSGLKDRIRPGDRLVVYVVRRGCSELCQSFVAVLEVTSEWRKSSRPMWPDEAREGKVLYPWVVSVRVITTGEADFSGIKDELSKAFGRKIERPDELRVYIMRELPSGVGELIEERLKARPKVTEAEKQAELGHKELVDMVGDVARWLGFRVEYEYPIDNFRVDVALFREPMAVPFAVVEVHVGGDVYKDLASLKHAHDRYGSRLVYVIARDEEVVMRLVDEAVQGAFHEIKDEIIILRAQELKQFHEVLKQESIRRLIRELMRK